MAVRFLVDDETVGTLRATRGLYWKAHNLRQRMADEGVTQDLLGFADAVLSGLTKGVRTDSGLAQGNLAPGDGRSYCWTE